MGFVYFILATGLAFLMYPYFDLPNLIMVYLLGVMVTAVQCGRGPAILNSLLSVLAFDFCFVPPRWSFTVEEAKYFVTFGVMFLVAVVISHLTSLIRRQAEAARLQERQTAAMQALSRELAGTRGVEKILQVAVQHISEIFECQVVALLPDDKASCARPPVILPRSSTRISSKNWGGPMDLRGGSDGRLGDPNLSGFAHSLCAPASGSGRTLAFWPYGPRS